MKPKVSVSVVSHGDFENITKLLESMNEHEDACQIEFLITDNVRELFGEFVANPSASLKVIVNQTPLGFAQNHNQAFQHARAEYFCILNPDILFTEPIFESLIARIENWRADILAPLVVDSQNIIQDSFRNLPKPSEIIARRLWKKKSVPQPTEPFSPDWLAGMFLFMRAETFRALGGFDEGYHLYFEDVDFCTRARLAGFRLLLDPYLRIRHDAHRASKRQLLYLYWHLRSAARFFRSDVYRTAKKTAW